MPDSQETRDSLNRAAKAAEELKRTVESFARRLKISQEQIEAQRKQGNRTRFLSVVALLTSLAVLVGGVLLYNVYGQIHEAQVQSCQNGNDSREQNRVLWHFILAASAANNPKMTPRQRKLSKDMLTWVDKLYAPRDCSDLTKKYKIPEPPPILGDTASGS